MIVYTTSPTENIAYAFQSVADIALPYKKGEITVADHFTENGNSLFGPTVSIHFNMTPLKEDTRLGMEAIKDFVAALKKVGVTKRDMTEHYSFSTQEATGKKTHHRVRLKEIMMDGFVPQDFTAALILTLDCNTKTELMLAGLYGICAADNSMRHVLEKRFVHPLDARQPDTTRAPRHTKMTRRPG